MEPLQYKISVLHYINPFLIWVEAEENVEQIGVFGVLPMELKLDPDEDTLMTKRSSEWMPAATVLMDNVFSDAVEVHFVAACIDDQRSTIFDDNIHKYGEILIKKPNGKYRLLSQLLVKSGFAIYDEDLFESELNAGNIKTKLTHNTTKDVIKIISKKSNRKKIDEQTKIFKTAETIESALTIKNLEAHNRNTNNAVDAFDTLQRKLNDLQMCKDIEKASVGRGSKKKVIDENNENKGPSALSAYFLKRLEQVNRTEANSDKSEKSVAKTDSETNIKDIKAIPEKPDKMNALKKLKLKRLEVTKECKEVDTAAHTLNREFGKVRHETSCDSDDINVNENDAEPHYSLNGINVAHHIRPRKSRKPNASCLPELDKNEKAVVFGPPDIKKTLLPVKAVPKDTFINSVGTFESLKPMGEMPMKKGKQDLYEAEDSDIDENKERLTQINNKIPQIKSAESVLKKKQRLHKKKIDSSTSDTSTKDSSTSFEEEKKFKNEVTLTSVNIDSDCDTISEVMDKVNADYKPLEVPEKKENIEKHTQSMKGSVNPFKNIDPSISVFVDKLVTPVLMVHSKFDKRFLPVSNIRDIPFNRHIQLILKNMSVEEPMMLQTVTWPVILRGYSTIIVSPKSSGKTFGYLPAVCRLIADHDSGLDGIGPSCIIVCATSNLVSETEMLAKLFLGSKEKVLAIYSGINELDLVTSLLNGCDLLICTPAILVRSLQTEHGVDLRRLRTFVLDDCERLSDVFSNEIKYFMIKIKEMLKNRVASEVKVQYILASRIWCGFMESLAKKAPDTVVCIGAFQECVLYSKAHTIATFVTQERKIQSVLDFLTEVDTSKRTVIVCRTNDEVENLEKALTQARYVVFAANQNMTVQNLYNLRSLWDDYQEPLIGPVLVCCDSNLTHLNITDAHYLIHYSLPNLFSAFCKRFSVLNENYPSIFKNNNKDVKIKILLEESNVEQLPKILHFIKRCTDQVPKALDELCDRILVEKDHIKAKRIVPVCDNLMAVGECPDFWNCQERHAIMKECDQPKDWLPRKGVITFKILHFHTAAYYSARLLTHTDEGETVKYPQNYSTLSMKLTMYFSRESNRKLLSFPKVGDICAVSLRQNFFVRCQIVKILSYYEKGTPNNILIRVIDEEKLEKTRDIYLYYLPDELKTPETHVVHVRLANIRPKDKDITFSDLAKEELKKIAFDDKNDDSIYMRGKVALTINNCILVDTVETCRDLSFINTVVLDNFKKELLDKHAIPNPDHLNILEKLCIEGGLSIQKQTKKCETELPISKLPSPQWAHLEKDDLSDIFFASALDPFTFYVRLVKFEQCCNILIKDIQNYVEGHPANIRNVNVGDFVLARFPDDGMYERARVHEIIDNDKVSCFFVDQGDWRYVSRQDLQPITEKLITQLPFQAIECRLVGVRPAGENWTEFAINWFTGCFQDNDGNLKQIYAKYFVKEKAENTGGHKYGVVLIDTNSEQDIVLNDLIMEVNLAREDENEIQFLQQVVLREDVKEQNDLSNSENDLEDNWEKVSKESTNSSNFEKIENPNLREVFYEKPIRSVPLIGSDESDTSEDHWNINMPEEFLSFLRPGNVVTNNVQNMPTSIAPAIQNIDDAKPCKNQRRDDPEISTIKTCKVGTPQDKSPDNTLNPSKSSKQVSGSQLVNSPKNKELDSDDLTSPPSSQISGSSELHKEIETKQATDEESNSKLHQEDQTATVKGTNKQHITNIGKDTQEVVLKRNVGDDLRKPKLSWWQKGEKVSVKIQLIGVEKYDIKIEERRLHFFSKVNDTSYGFELELYGIVDLKNVKHENKGQYILVNLTKLMNRNWLTLTKGGGIQKWIVYDVDSIDISSEEEDEDVPTKDALKYYCKEQNSDDSEDEEFLDDVNFRYSK